MSSPRPLYSIFVAFSLFVVVTTGCPAPIAEDAGANDAGANDAGTNDAGTNDAGTNDAGTIDAGANDAGTNDAGTNDAGTNDAGTNDAGDVDQCDPAQCDGTCEAVFLGGGRTYCVRENPAPLSCGDGGIPPQLEGFGHCCSDDDCDGAGVCGPGGGFCGGAAPPEGLNTCRTPDCLSDEDCEATQACVIGGFSGLYVRTCTAAECRTDDDCTDGTGGRCDAYGSGHPCDLTLAFACSYIEDECGPAGGNQVCPPSQNGSVCYPKVDASGVECRDLPPPAP